MRILVACEESQTVCKAFRAKGHVAFSCDILPCSGGHPEWHIQLDVYKILNMGWDMMLAYPPCEFLTNTANRVYVNNPERWRKRLEAIMFVWGLWTCRIKKIAIENPVGALSTHIGKPNQYIQPYEFGHPDSKKTCLWLKNLHPLTPTNEVEPEWIIPPSGKRMSITHAKTASSHSPANRKLRSKTYQGIADAKASQWGSD